jgi:hypothetical protein
MTIDDDLRDLADSLCGRPTWWDTFPNEWTEAEAIAFGRAPESEQWAYHHDLLDRPILVEVDERGVIRQVHGFVPRDGNDHRH